MRKLVPICLVVAGAGIGGIFPGAITAFFVAVSTGIDGLGGEAVCLTANLLFGVVGAVCGKVAGQGAEQKAFRGVDLMVPITLGLVCGMIGFIWLYYVISYADPPL
jgi:hypothetical protein